MEPENKNNLKIFAIMLILTGAISVISAIFLQPLIAVLLSLLGHILIIIAMLLLFIIQE